MSDSTIFIAGLFVFLILAGGLTITLREFSKMGSKDQKDDYPRVGWFS